MKLPIFSGCCARNFLLGLIDEAAFKYDLVYLRKITKAFEKSRWIRMKLKYTLERACYVD